MECDEFGLSISEVLALQSHATESLGVSLGGLLQGTFTLLVRRYQGLDEADIPLNLYAFGNIARSALEVPHTILVPGSESPASTAAVTTVATLTDSLALSMRKAQDVFQSLNASVNTVFKSTGSSATSFLQLMESKSIADESLAAACSQSSKANVPAFVWCHGAANPSITSTVSLPWSLSLTVSVSADPSSLLRFQFRYPPLPIKVQGDPRRRCVPHTLYLWASMLQRLIQHVSPAAAPAPQISMPSSSIADRWTLGNAPLLTPPERDLLLDSFSGCIENARGQCKLPSGQLLTDIWADTVKKYPQNTAVVSVTQNIRWTYAEMDAKSSQLAQWLQSRGVGAGNTVGFFLPRSAQMYVTLLAILKAGAAYVPIDPEYPADRCSFILTDAGAPVLLTMSSLPVFAPLKSIVARAPLEAYHAEDESVKHEKYVEPSGDAQGDAALTAAARQREARRILTPFEGEVLFLDDEDFQRTLAEFDPKVVVAPNQIDSTGARVKMSASERCYIIYTSGSTGRPKGVAIEHRAACCLVEAERMLFGVRPNDVIYQGFSISFDASVEELWLAWASGGALFCATPDIIHAGPALSSILVKHGVTVVSTVPTLLSMLESEIPCMRILILGGEACQRDLILKWAKPGRRMVNTYGPTEATVIATYLDCHVDISLVTIGRPIPNYFCYIIDPNTQQICPVGVTGELCIGGVCLSRGYVGRDELTVKVFIPNDFKRDESGDDAMHKFPDQFLRKLPPPVPMAQSASDKSKPVTAAIVPGAVSHLDPARLYRTGDLTRWTEDGNIEFLGRIDAQVKLRGFRVELSEIESVLMQCDGVVSAVCTVREVAGVQQLVAYVVAKGANANTKLPVKVWKKALRVRLPPYMVPSIFEQIDDIPTLPSGKADRKKLPPPRPAAESAGGEDEDEDDGPALSKDELAALSPKTPMEIKLAAVWRELFAKSRILLNDDFFELGGHSLLAARLMTVLRKEDWTSHAAMADVYQHPTVQSLAAFLTETAPAPVVRRSSSMGSKRAKSTVSIASTSSLLSPQSMKTPLLEGDELEEESDHPEDAVLPVSPCKYWLTGLLQLPFILMYLMILSVQQLLPWRTYSFMYDRDYSLWQIVLTSMFSVSVLYMVLMLLAVIAKWVLIGRFKPGKYPIWGSFYFRWWIVTRLIDLLPTTFMRGTVLITWFYRALGAKIGKHVHVSTYRLDGFDLVSIGDHTSLCIDCQLQPIRFLNGYMIVGSIEIGERCYIGAKSVIVGGLKRPTVVQDEAQLDQASLLPCGSTMCANEVWRGSPAKMIGRVAPVDRVRLAYEEPSFLRQVLFSIGQSLSYWFVGATILLASGPAILVFFYYSDIVEGAVGWWMLMILPIPFATSFAFGLAFWIAVFKWLIIGKWKTRVVYMYSFEYLRKWTVDNLMELSMFYLHAMYASMWLTPWYRWLGADLGEHVEISTASHVTPDFIHLKDGVFIADTVYLGPEKVYLGYCHLGPVRVGAKSFCGNGALIPSDTFIGDQCLVGVMSTTPRGNLVNAVAHGAGPSTGSIAALHLSPNRTPMLLPGNSPKLGPSPAAASSSSQGYSRLQQADDSTDHVALPMIADGVIPSFNMQRPGTLPQADCCLCMDSQMPWNDEQLEATRVANISRAESRTDWLGSPALRLPRRAAASGNFDSSQTFNPPTSLRVARLIIEYFRIVIPTSVFVIPIIFLIDQNWLFNLVGGVEWKVWVLLWPSIYLCTAVSGVVFTWLCKWILMGRFVKSEEPLWSSFVWRTEFINALCESLVNPTFMNFVRGTPWITFWLRSMGCDVGKYSFIGSLQVTEFDLVVIGDEAIIGVDAVLQTHLFEDRVMKMSYVRVGAKACVSAYSVVLYDTELEAGATLGACSLLMKGETLPAWTNWQGLPAKRYYDLDDELPEDAEQSFEYSPLEDTQDHSHLNTPEVVRRAMVGKDESASRVHSLTERRSSLNQ